MTANEIIKRVAEFLPHRVAGTPRQMFEPRLVIVYHNVALALMTRRGAPLLQLPLSLCLRRSDTIKEQCRMRPPPVLLDSEALSGDSIIVIAFDDLYRGALAFAHPEWERRGLPSAIVVAPWLLVMPPFWWDQPEGSEGQLCTMARRRLLEHLGGRRELIRATIFVVPQAEQLAALYAAASEAQILESRSFNAQPIAAQSWSSPNLSQRTEASRATESRPPSDWLTSQGSALLPYIAYRLEVAPPSVEGVARVAGQCAGSVVDGWWGGIASAKPNSNVPGDPAHDGCAFRLEGVVSH